LGERLVLLLDLDAALVGAVRMSSIRSAAARPSTSAAAPNSTRLSDTTLTPSRDRTIDGSTRPWEWP